MIITLTNEEWEKICKMSDEMVEHKRSQGAQNQKASYEPDVVVERRGFAGELAVHKHLGIPYRYNFQRTQTLIDITLKYGNMAIPTDIKTSKDGILKVNWRQIEHRNLPHLAEPIAYVGVWQLNELEYDIQGVISKERFLEYAEKKMLLSWCYCLEGEGLNKLVSIDRFTAWK